MAYGHQRPLHLKEFAMSRTLRALLGLTGIAVVATAAVLVIPHLTAMANRPPATGTMKLVAGTTHLPGLILTESLPMPNISGATKVADAHCPQGKVVVGGYGYVDDATHSRAINLHAKLTQFGPNQDPATGAYSYRIGALAVAGYQGAWSVVARAYCADRPAGYEYVPPTTIARSTNPLKVAQRSCDGSRVILSAGALLTAPTVADLSPVTLGGVIAQSDSQAMAYAQSPRAVTWSMSLHLVCAYRTPGYVRTGRTSALYTAVTVDSGALCPQGTYAYSGLGWLDQVLDLHLAGFRLTTGSVVLTAGLDPPYPPTQYRVHPQVICMN
jgi:hypothetical protein